MKTVYIIIAFCVGLLLGHLIFPTERELKLPVYVQLEEAKKGLAKVDSGYVSQQSIFQKQNDSLKTELNGYKFLLTNARKELALNRNKTSLLVNVAKGDTTCDPVLIDSLSDQIVIVNQITDSLILHYERRDTILEHMVAIRDTQIFFCNRSYQEIKNLAEEQMLREQKLTDDLNTALKQQKRKRLQNKILAAGMLFVSGITTTLYIKSKQ